MFSEVARKMEEETLSVPLCIEPQVNVFSKTAKSRMLLLIHTLLFAHRHTFICLEKMWMDCQETRKSSFLWGRGNEADWSKGGNKTLHYKPL